MEEETEKLIEESEKVEVERKNLKWMLAVSLIIFVFMFYSITGYVYYPYSFRVKDA